MLEHPLDIGGCIDLSEGAQTSGVDFLAARLQQLEELGFSNCWKGVSSYALALFCRPSFIRLIS